MRYDDFISRVQDRMNTDDREAAVRAVEATLATLGERLTTPQRTALASQLPDELKRLLYRWQRTRRFMLEDFYKRAASRSDVGFEDGVENARAVGQVLKEAVSAGEIESLLSDLPNEFGEFFGAQASGPLSPSRE